MVYSILISNLDGSLLDLDLAITVLLRRAVVQEVRWDQEALEVLSPTTTLLLHRTVSSLFFCCRSRVGMQMVRPRTFSKWIRLCGLPVSAPKFKFLSLQFCYYCFMSSITHIFLSSYYYYLFVMYEV